MSFFDIFNHPLTHEEIKKYMYQYEVADWELREILALSPHIEQKNEYYFLKGKVENVYLRKKRQESIHKSWKRVFRFVPKLQHFPFVRMAAICNTLAFQTSDHNSDIDLFIVVEKGHLWIARLMITTYFHLFGVRRHGKKVAGRFCLSFFTTTDNLNLQHLAKEPYDIYLAYWIATMVPIFGEQYYEQVLEENRSFLEQYFGEKHVNNNARIRSQGSISHNVQSTQEKIWNSPVGKPIEDFVRNYQRNRAFRKLHNLRPGHSNVVSDHMLKSHDHDKRDFFRDEYERRMKLMGLM